MIVNKNKVLDISKKMPFDISEMQKVVPNEIPNGKRVAGGICIIDGVVYFAKKVDEEEAINELIGSLLAKRLNLDTVDYKVGLDNENNVYSVSKIFFDSKYYYLHPRLELNGAWDIFSIDLNKARHYHCEDVISPLNTKMKDDILKLTALDIKMCQMDRHPQNVMIKVDKETRKMSFTPFYDYACSYDFYDVEPEKLFYDNPYLLVRKNVSSLRALVRRYPQIYNYFNSMATIDMESIISQIEDENDIILSPIQKSYYIDKDEKYNKVLMKI